MFYSCTSKKEKNQTFTYVSKDTSGIDFINSITENDTINVIDFQYCYNGGGVGIGDFNNDGLPDLVFTGNQVSSKVYLNQGNMSFIDISESANFITNTWVTGVSIVDINLDGLDDIYLNVGGPDCRDLSCKNLLFINNGLDTNGTIRFTEQAKAYGLDDGNYSQQTLFFDYDQDGDLDAYIAHNGNTNKERNTPVPKKYFPDILVDKLLENVTQKDTGQPYFVDVSDSLGIVHKGFSLGIAISDFNNDHLPDIYVSNDFITNDLIYINKGKDDNGIHQGFEEKNNTIVSKQTYNAMGVDIGDLNNDELPDIMIVDMLPKDYERQKKMLGIHNYDKFLLSQRNGYTPQYIHNTLQIHNGFVGQNILPTSEIAYAAGIASTDWSWAPLIADYDNDGNKDIYITNGYVKDITDLDFINYSDQNTIFGSPQARKNKLKGFVDQLPGIHLSNVLYKNMGKTRFQDVSKEWIQPKKSFSNGAAYADLDLDGDLDLIVNNINQPAFILENHTSEKSKNYLRVALSGSPKNKKAIGAKVTIWQNNTPQTQYQSTIKGYLSSVESILHFGVTKDSIEKIKVDWPDGTVTIKENVTANQVIQIHKTDPKQDVTSYKNPLLFQKTTNYFSYKHQENFFNDYTYQSLLPHQFNASGPCISASDADNKTGDEIFIGGSKGYPGLLFTETKDKKYNVVQEFDSEFEDTSVLFVDIDNDGDQDLYLGSGGTETITNPQLLQDRIFINDGKGKFDRSQANQLPRIETNTTCSIANDIDGDGYPEIFIGGGVQSGKYPLATSSYLLNNDSGNLSINTHVSFTHQGITTDASWADINGDQSKELIIAGHWMPITIYQITKNEAKEIPIQWQNPQGKKINISGWWNSIAIADFDNDGDNDIIAGNQGINGFVKPVFDQPVYVYKKDFDNNGSIDPILAQYFETQEGTILKPIHTRDDIMKQLVTLKKKYTTYDAFAKTSFTALLDITDLDKETLSAHTFNSIYAENIGNNTFVVYKLPSACQWSPINDFLVKDFNNDGYKDVLTIGNNYGSEANYGRYDASLGTYLQGSANGFKIIPNHASGFWITKQSNHIITTQNSNKESLILTTQNNDSICVFTTKINEETGLVQN